MNAALRFTLLVLAAWPPAAATAADQSARRPPTDPNKMICRSSTQIGSRLDTKRVCRTVAEWKESEKEQRDFVQGLRNSTSGCRPDLANHYC